MRYLPSKGTTKLYTCRRVCASYISCFFFRVVPAAAAVNGASEDRDKLTEREFFGEMEEKREDNKFNYVFKMSEFSYSKMVNGCDSSEKMK